VARLCILWEDLALEINGLVHDDIPCLDTASDSWRKMYFWRNMVRTLAEIRRVLDTISQLSDFKTELAKQTPAWRKTFKDTVQKFNQTRAYVSRVRDNLGGHVLDQGVAQALRSMPDDHFGIIQIGNSMNNTHFKVAAELVSEILLSDTPKSERLAKIEKQLKAVRELIPVYRVIYHILFMYADSRGLV
jgi:hypothetical protein